MSDLSGRLSGGQAISGSLSGGGTLRGGLSMGGVSPLDLLDKADVITDTASGSIASFPDGMAAPALSVVVDVDPVQDLHGYANPWPAGGGKNIAKISDDVILNSQFSNIQYTDTGIEITATGQYARAGYVFNVESGEKYTISVYGSSDGDYHQIYLNDSADWGSSYGSINITSPTKATYSNTITATSTTLFVGFYVTAGTTTGSMSIENFQIEKGTSATSFEPYENICPITGWTEANIKRTGINISGATIRQHNANNIFTTGTLLKAGTYTAFFSWSGTFDGMYIKTADDITSPHIAVKYNANAVTFTIDKAETIYVQGLKNGGVTATDVSFQLEPGSNASAYKPYTGEAYAIQLGQTVYGCLIYATQGKLKIETAFYSFNGTESGWRQSRTYPGSFYINTGVSHIFPSDKAICSHAANNNAFPAGYEYGMFGLDGSNKVNINVFVQQPGTTLEQFKTWLAGQYANGTPLTFVLEIASPVEIDLTPTEIDLLFGDNNIWADSGDTTVEYRADTKLWILKKIAQALNA